MTQYNTIYFGTEMTTTNYFLLLKRLKLKKTTSIQWKMKRTIGIRLNEL